MLKILDLEFIEIETCQETEKCQLQIYLLYSAWFSLHWGRRTPGKVMAVLGVVAATLDHYCSTSILGWIVRQNRVNGKLDKTAENPRDIYLLHCKKCCLEVCLNHIQIYGTWRKEEKGTASWPIHSQVWTSQDLKGKAWPRYAFKTQNISFNCIKECFLFPHTLYCTFLRWAMGLGVGLRGHPIIWSVQFTRTWQFIIIIGL